MALLLVSLIVIHTIEINSATFHVSKTQSIRVIIGANIIMLMFVVLYFFPLFIYVQKFDKSKDKRIINKKEEERTKERKKERKLLSCY